MKHLITSDGTSLMIDDLFDRAGWNSCHATITDSMMGPLPTIELTMQCESPICNRGEEFKGWLMDKNLNKEEFKCYVVEVEFSTQTSRISLVCTTPKFNRDLVVTKYSDLMNGINSTWQLPIRKVPKSFDTDVTSLDDNHSFYQKNETNKYMCTKLCSGYKKGVLYGYSISGLVLMDLNQWEPVDELNDQVEINLKDPASFIKPKLYEQEDNFISYSANDPNHVSVQYYSQVMQVDSAYKIFLGNILYNQRYKNPINTNSFTMNTYKSYLLGDGLQIKSEQNKYIEPRIMKRVINIDENECHVDYTIQSFKIE